MFETWQLSLRMSKIDMPQSPSLCRFWRMVKKPFFFHDSEVCLHIHVITLSKFVVQVLLEEHFKILSFHQAFQTIWHQLLPMFFSPWYLNTTNPIQTQLLPLKSITQQITPNVSIRHKVHVCHRDLKPEHFLLARTGPLDVVPLHLGWDSAQLRRTW